MPTSPRYFGLFGSRGTGKTAYLASFYLSTGDEADGGLAYHASASEEPDDRTHAYLRRIGLDLREGRWPDSSPYDRPTELKIRFQRGDLDRGLVLPDVCGELTSREKQTSPDLKKQILADYLDLNQA
jgi:hypothetical protein